MHIAKAQFPAKKKCPAIFMAGHFLYKINKALLPGYMHGDLPP